MTETVKVELKTQKPVWAGDDIFVSILVWNTMPNKRITNSESFKALRN